MHGAVDASTAMNADGFLSFELLPRRLGMRMCHWTLCTWSFFLMTTTREEAMAAVAATIRLGRAGGRPCRGKIDAVAIYRSLKRAMPPRTCYGRQFSQAAGTL